MKKVVIYSSLTGNTKKVASVISETIGCEMFDYKDIGIQKLTEFDFIGIGFYIDKGDIDEGFRPIANSINGKKIGLFITMGGDTNSEYAINAIQNFKNRFISQDNEVLTTFYCQGAIDPNLIDKMREMAKMFPDDQRHMITPEKEARWARASTHPDENDLKNAKKAFEIIKNL